MQASATSPLALAHAAAIAQGLVCMRAALANDRLRRFFLFASPTVREKGCAYGLWRQDRGAYLPLPAASAFSTASLLLERPTYPLEIIPANYVAAATAPYGGGGGMALAFGSFTRSSREDARSSAALVVAWTSGNGTVNALAHTPLCVRYPPTAERCV